MAKGRTGKVGHTTACKLWAKAAGRCEYEGCNQLLYRDNLTSEEINHALIAHIVAASPDGPRGSKTDSARLVDDVENIMLMCNTHHRLIDHEGLSTHSVERLRAMKKKHEDRIRMLTGINASKVSLPVVYMASIGKKTPRITRGELSNAMIPINYPSDRVIEISYKSSSTYDNEELFWLMEVKQIEDKVTRDILPLFSSGEYDSIALFAMGPQPLLVKLGTLLNDMYKVRVFQKHREPDTWAWQTDFTPNYFKVSTPTDKTKMPILVFAVSAKAIIRRVKRKYGKEASIWVITVDKPGNNMLKSVSQLVEFRDVVRRVMDDINTSTPEASIKVYMAMPAACAVEFGRVWMPKADKPLVLFDKAHGIDDDIETITIN